MSKRKKIIRKKIAKRKKAKKISILGKQKIKKYASITAVGVLVLISAIFIISNNQDSLFFQLKENMQGKMMQLSADIGFKIKEVNLHGRVNSDPNLILTMLNVKAGDPILAFKAEDATSFIKEIAWIKNVKIRRKLPDRIDIYIEERKSIALWQYGGAVSVIDRNGNKLTSGNLDEFSHLPLVVGKYANGLAKDIINIIRAEPDIYKNTDAIINVSNRRWDLKLANKIKIKLPEKDVELALSKLAKAHRENNILDKNLQYIDIRLNDKIIVKPANDNKSAKKNYSQK